jgi:hypothetical protein
MGKRIIFIHGRSFKPDKQPLWNIWKAATRHGIERSYPEKLQAYDGAQKAFAYYGDHSNRFLGRKGRSYSAVKDVADRKISLAQLKKYESHDFTEKAYKGLAGSSPVKEFLADIAGGPLNWIGLGEKGISAVAPDMREYWNPDSQFGSNVRWPFTSDLEKAMKSDDDILVIAHSLGTLIAWDTFWKFSYYAEYQAYRDRSVSLLVTLGSPLADETVKDNLKGARAKGSRRFPSNIVRWENIAAEDDFISHDQCVANDFEDMLAYDNATKKINDHRISNLAVRGKKSNPHSSVGYLIHPKTSELIAKWL